MITIWKYPLLITGHQEIQMPHGAEPLCVQMQDWVPTLWAILNSDLLLEPFDVCMLGTGHELRTSLPPYVGTVQDPNGFVWHFFCGHRTFDSKWQA